MTRKRLLQFVPLMVLCVASVAAQPVCTLTSAGTTANVPCGAALFTATDFLNWGAPVAGSGYSGLGDANSPPVPGPVNATTSGGIGVAINSSNMLISRADNTQLAWCDLIGCWTSPTIVEEVNSGDYSATVNAFGGHFGAPDCAEAKPPYGDNLLGVTAPPGPSVGNASLTMNFATAVAGAAFPVSSGQNGDFVATMAAFDAQNNLLGIYQIDTATHSAGLGGACAGLGNPNITGGDPVPCNDAPLMQFYDPQGRIKRVFLTVNDTQSAYIGQLSMLPASR